MRGNGTDARELVLLASLLVFVAGLCLQPISETDLYFRLKVGSEILARRALLGRNLFSFTAPDHPDLDLSWGFEVAAALIHRAGGFPAVVAAKAVWMVATFAGLFAVCRRTGAAALATTATLAAVALVMRERLVERPHIISFAGEVAVLAALTGLCGVWNWRRGGALGLAMLAWANMHAGLFAGVIMSLLAAAPTGGWSAMDRRRARRALVLAAGIAAAAALTPVGPLGLARYLRLHLTLPALHPIDEFRQATWRSDWPFLVWLGAVAVVLGACRFLRTNPEPGPHPESGTPGSREPETAALSRGWPGLGHVLPAAGISALGLLSVRFSADAALVGAPLLAVGLTSLQRRAVARSRSAHAQSAWGATWGVTAVAAASLLTATLGPRLVEARAGRPFLDVELDRSTLPLRALRFVEENGLREHMYNDFEIGSYLLFEGYPRYRVFVDPRLPAYPEEMHRLLGTFDLQPAAWGVAMTSYGVETALLAYAGFNRRVAWWDPQEWALVYRAGDSRVFVRRRAHWRALIAAHEIPATFTFSVEQGAATRLLETPPARSPVSACEWQRRLGELVFELDGGKTERARAYFERALAAPHCLAPRDEAALAAWMGALELEAADGSHPLAHLERALELAPADTPTRANRATLLERLGRRADAAADWNRVAAAARGTVIGDAAAARARALAR